jgi:lipopolysaccharide transport system permease protein
MSHSEAIKIIDSQPDRFVDYLKKICTFRALIWAFAKRDLKVKYAQTWLGLGWTIAQPLTGLVIFTFFFGYVLQWKAGELPYAIYVLSGLLGWNLFSFVVSTGIHSIQESSVIIKKIYLPKSILPLSKVLFALVELGITLLLLIPLMWYYDIRLSWHVVFFPVALLYNILCALTLVFWTAALAYKKRDLYHLIPFLLYFGIWLTPVFFTHEFFPERLGILVDLNPMANVVDFWRWALFGFTDFKPVWISNFALMGIFFLSGMYLYNRKEHEMSDYL